MPTSSARGTVAEMIVRLHAPDGSCLLSIETPTPGPAEPTAIDPADVPRYVPVVDGLPVINGVHAPGHRALVTD